MKLLSVDVEKGRLALGIKQLTEDPWKDVDKDLHLDDVVQGKVVHVADFGVFIELKEGLEGLIHFSEVGKDISKKQLLEKFPTNAEVPIRILKIDVYEKRLSLAPVINDEDSKLEPAKAETATLEAEPVMAEKTETATLEAEPVKAEKIETATLDAKETKPDNTEESA